MVVPAIAVMEFLAGHPRDLVRAERVLALFREIPETSELARRAVELRRLVLRSQGRDPGLSDALVAAIAETEGAVVTRDATDFRALAAVSKGFAVLDLAELRRAVPSSRETRRRRRHRQKKR